MINIYFVCDSDIFSGRVGRLGYAVLDPEHRIADSRHGKTPLWAHKVKGHIRTRDGHHLADTGACDILCAMMCQWRTTKRLANYRVHLSKRCMAHRRKGGRRSCVHCIAYMLNNAQCAQAPINFVKCAARRLYIPSTDILSCVTMERKDVLSTKR